MASSFFSSPPLTTGIPRDALRPAAAGEAPSPRFTLIRAVSTPNPSQQLEPAEPALLAWELASRVSQLLGSGIPRSLELRGRRDPLVARRASGGARVHRA